MALVDAATWKTQNAAIAAALTVMYQDDTLTEIAADIKNPHHPLRIMKRGLSLDPATGITVSDDDYIDAAYAGAFPNKGTNFQVMGKSLLALVTATVETAAAANIVLTFDKAISSFDDLTISGDASPAKSIVGVAIAGAVVTVTVNVAYIAADVITLSGVFRSIEGGTDILAAQVVTNNVV